MKIKNKIEKLLIFGLSSLLPLVALADIASTMEKIKTAAWTIGDGLIVIGVIWVGVLFLTSAGSEERLTKAKKGLVWVIVGTVLILGFNAFIGIIQGLAS